MDRRNALFALGSLILYKRFVRYNETIYVNKTLRSSDYSKFDVQKCHIKRGPFLPKDELLIYLDTDDYCFRNNTIYV